MSRFKVGQKVVCVSSPKDKFNRPEHEIDPQAGRIYTIRDVCDRDGILLKEIINKPDYYVDNGVIVKAEVSFHKSLFAPIEEYTDSLSIAESLVKELSEVDKAKEPLKEFA